MNKSKKPTQMYISFFKKNPHLRIWLLILEKGKAGGGERETSIGCLPFVSRLGPNHNLGMCLDWRATLLPFGVRDDTQPTEPPSQGANVHFLHSKTRLLVNYDVIPSQNGYSRLVSSPEPDYY